MSNLQRMSKEQLILENSMCRAKLQNAVERLNLNDYKRTELHKQLSELQKSDDHTKKTIRCTTKTLRLVLYQLRQINDKPKPLEEMYKTLQLELGALNYSLKQTKMLVMTGCYGAKLDPREARILSKLILKEPDRNTKFRWKMQFCKDKGLAPADACVWDIAEMAFNKQHKVN